MKVTAVTPFVVDPGCGKNWLQWSDAGDGRNDPNLGMVVLRNMLPDPSFPYSIQNNPLLPLNMGAYLPTVTYTSKSGFEALGCTSS